MYGYVYKLTNTLNNKVYVGQHKSKTFDQNYWGSGTYIARAINKHGTSVFKREILCWCRTKEELDKAESDCIENNDCFYPNGYNLTAGGFGGDTFSKLSENDLKEIKSKMSHALKGKPKSEEMKKKLSAYMKQRVRQNPDYFRNLRLKGSETALKNKSYLKGAEATKGKHWYTNGKSNIISFECPDGYFRGRIINH